MYLKKKLSKQFASTAFLCSMGLCVIALCPYLFITFPIYLLMNVGIAIEFYHVLHNNEYTGKTKFILMLVLLILMIMYSYQVFCSQSFSQLHFTK
jgi:hypothetical protein